MTQQYTKIMESDEDFALHMADTMKQGCESAGFTVEILPSVGGYAMSIYSTTDDVQCEVLIHPTGYQHTLN